MISFCLCFIDNYALDLDPKDGIGWERKTKYPEFIKPRFKYTEVFSPLMCAVLEDNARMVEKCLFAGYDDPTERFSFSRTMLHVAQSEYVESMLIQSGVSYSAKDFNGKQARNMTYDDRRRLAKCMMSTRYMLFS